MKHLIIYHAHCNDGFGAAWAAWKALKDNGPVILHSAVYGKEPPYELIDEDVVVHIVDFSYAPDTMITICQAANNVVWLDHHKTAIDAWSQYGAAGTEYPDNLYAKLDINYSGAMLAWNYYHPDKQPPRIIEHINDRDLWLFKLKDTKAIHLNLNTLPKDIDVWDALIANTNQSGFEFNKFVAAGEAIQRYNDQLIQNILATNKVEAFIDGVRGLACNCPGALASDLGHLLANESGTYGLTWEENNKAAEKCSLRSNGDFDVSAIAKSFGGGGHKNAAGFTLELNDNINHSRIRFKPL